MSNEFQFIFSTKRCEISRSLTLRFQTEEKDFDKFMCEDFPLFTPIQENCEKTTPSNIQFGIPAEGGYTNGKIYLLTNEFDKLDGITPIAVKRLSKEIVARSSHLPISLTPPVKASQVYHSRLTQTDLIESPSKEQIIRETQVFPTFFSIDSIDYYARPILLPIGSYACRFIISEKDTDLSLKRFEEMIINSATHMRDNITLRNANKSIRPYTGNELAYLLLADHPDYLIRFISKRTKHNCSYGDCIINWIEQIRPYTNVIDSPRLLVLSYMVYLICFLFTFSDNQEIASICSFLAEILEPGINRLIYNSIELLQVKTHPVNADLKTIRELYLRYTTLPLCHDDETVTNTSSPIDAENNPLDSTQTSIRPVALQEALDILHSTVNNELPFANGQ